MRGRKASPWLAVNALAGGLLRSTREAWQAACNEALADAGSSARVDHRSLRAQGRDWLRVPHQGQAVHVREPRDGYARKRADLMQAHFQRRAHQAVRAVVRDAHRAGPPASHGGRPSTLEADQHQARIAGMRRAVHQAVRLNGARLARDGAAWAAMLAAELRGRPAEPPDPSPEVGHDR